MFQRYSHPTLTQLQNAVESLNANSTWVTSRDTAIGAEG